MGALTWGEMKDMLIQKHGVAERSVEMADGETLVYLERANGGKKLLHTLPVLLEKDEFLTPSMIRNICDSLKVPKKDFGLPIG